MTYPKHLYHPDGRSFMCPSQEFQNSLEDGKEFEDMPFTGERKIVKEDIFDKYNKLVEDYNAILNKNTDLKEANKTLKATVEMLKLKKGK